MMLILGTIELAPIVSSVILKTVYLSDLKKAIEIDKNFIESAKQDKDFENIRNDERFKALIMK
jgi:hypothetical protein